MWFVRSLVHFFYLWTPKSEQFIQESRRKFAPNLKKFPQSVLEILRSQEWDGWTIFYAPDDDYHQQGSKKKKIVLVWCVGFNTVYYSSVTILSGNVHAAHGTRTPQVVTTVLLRRIGSWEEAFTSPALSATPPRASTVGYRLIWRHKNVHPSLVSPWSACITDQAFHVLL